MELEILYKEIFDEFIIDDSEAPGRATVRATPKTLELLNINDAYFEQVAALFRTDFVKARNIVIFKTYEAYYRAALLRYISERYRIHAITRKSQGNSHDASSQLEATLFDDLGGWGDYLEKYISLHGPSAYSHHPIVLKEHEITNKIIWKWAQDYDLEWCGEEYYGRQVYCTDKDGKTKYRITIFTHFRGEDGLKYYEDAQVYDEVSASFKIEKYNEETREIEELLNY